MKRRTTIAHEFVELMPVTLTEGTLYVSIPYATAIHLCACGCGNKVVTPISPADWSLTFDGDTVSLHPSIGGWQLPCRSHYWIRNNTIRWAAAWTDEEIEEGRNQDAEDMDLYFASRRDNDSSQVDLPPVKPNAEMARKGPFRRFFRK